MKFRQIRSALSIVEFAGVRFLIDPMLGDKYEYPPIPMTVNCAPGTPTSDLPVPVESLFDVDAVIASDFPNPIDAPIEVKTVDIDKIPADMEALDIGEATQKLFADAIKGAKTVVWNGPMGVFENPILAKGTIAVAQAMADAKGATTIIGGGDSAAAVQQLGFADKMTHISTGGGASLELMEGKVLPGIACLNDKD